MTVTAVAGTRHRPISMMERRNLQEDIWLRWMMRGRSCDGTPSFLVLTFAGENDWSMFTLAVHVKMFHVSMSVLLRMAVTQEGKDLL